MMHGHEVFTTGYAERDARALGADQRSVAKALVLKGVLAGVRVGLNLIGVVGGTRHY